MAEIERVLTVDKPTALVWDYLSDFCSTNDWDPGTVETVRTSGDGGPGTTYRNTSRFLGRETRLTYTVTEMRPGGPPCRCTAWPGWPSRWSGSG